MVKLNLSLCSTKHTLWSRIYFLS